MTFQNHHLSSQFVSSISLERTDRVHAYHESQHSFSTNSNLYHSERTWSTYWNISHWQHLYWLGAFLTGSHPSKQRVRAYYIPTHNTYVHTSHPSTQRAYVHITSQHTTRTTSYEHITSQHTTLTCISHPSTQHVRAYHISAHNTYEHITSQHTTRTSISHLSTQHVRAYHISAHNTYEHIPSQHTTRTSISHLSTQHVRAYPISAHNARTSISHLSTQTRTSISHLSTQHVRAYHISAHNTYEHITPQHTTRTCISHLSTQHVCAYHMYTCIHIAWPLCIYVFTQKQNEINSRRYLEGFIIDGLQHLVNVDGLERDTALDVLLHRSFRIYGWKQICGIQCIINIRNSFIVRQKFTILRPNSNEITSHA